LWHVETLKCLIEGRLSRSRRFITGRRLRVKGKSCFNLSYVQLNDSCTGKPSRYCYSEVRRGAPQNPARHRTFPDSDTMWRQADLASYDTVHGFYDESSLSFLPSLLGIAAADTSRFRSTVLESEQVRVVTLPVP
jgi:hypothetical protein